MQEEEVATLVEGQETFAAVPKSEELREEEPKRRLLKTFERRLKTKVTRD